MRVLESVCGMGDGEWVGGEGGRRTVSKSFYIFLSAR